VDKSTFSQTDNSLMKKIITPLMIRQALTLCEKESLKSQLFHIQALWDTGVEISYISERVAHQLKLKKIKPCSISGIDIEKDSYMHIVDLIFPQNFIFLDVEAAEFPGNDHFNFIIGMNIIKYGDLLIQNYDSKTRLSFRYPSSKDPIIFQ
jgi:hypothetical protein